MIKVRTSCIVVCGDELCLIYRVDQGQENWSLPGGNVGVDEDFQAAIVRELQEEIGLTGVQPEFLFIQDMFVHRPGYNKKYRKLHIIFRVIIRPEVRHSLKTTETDDLLGVGQVRWVSRCRAAHLHLYPGIGSVLGELSSLDTPITPAVLPTLTDKNYTWHDHGMPKSSSKAN
jgi:8-oxo-dGTP diphosphatase